MPSDKRNLGARTNIWLPKEIRDGLKTALKRRAELDELTGRVSPKTISAFVREKAIETIASYK